MTDEPNVNVEALTHKDSEAALHIEHEYYAALRRMDKLERKIVMLEKENQWYADAYSNLAKQVGSIYLEAHKTYNDLTMVRLRLGDRID